MNLLHTLGLMTRKEQYLVWSNEHRAWWAPKRCGYTDDIHAAGRYGRAEAISIAGTARGGWERGNNPHEIAIPEADALEQALHPARLESWRQMDRDRAAGKRGKSNG